MLYAAFLVVGIALGAAGTILLAVVVTKADREVRQADNVECP